MRRGYRRTTALGLLLLMAIPVCFCAGVLLKQKLLQLKRNSRFETEMMQTISVMPDNFQWIKKGKEARINGKLFDVQSFSITKNAILVTGFFDGKEEKLAEQIRELAEEKEDPANPYHNLSFVKIFFAPVYTEPGVQLIQCPWLTIHKHNFVYSDIIPDRVQVADTPPPKLS